MNPKFRETVDALHPAFERLIAAKPYIRGNPLPRRGVYLFSEKDKPIYVGRSDNIPRRYGQHTLPSSQTNQAALASLIAKEELDLLPDYRPGARARLLANELFTAAFHKAKQRIRSMEFRAVEETDPLKQALIEVYCAVVLETPYNDFSNH
jgi:hypothetical protein